MKADLSLKFTHALPKPVQPDVKFIPERVVVPRLHDIVTGFEPE